MSLHKSSLASRYGTFSRGKHCNGHGLGSNTSQPPFGWKREIQRISRTPAAHSEDGCKDVQGRGPMFALFLQALLSIHHCIIQPCARDNTNSSSDPNSTFPPADFNWTQFLCWVLQFLHKHYFRAAQMQNYKPAQLRSSSRQHSQDIPPYFYTILSWRNRAAKEDPHSILNFKVYHVKCQLNNCILSLPCASHSVQSSKNCMSLRTTVKHFKSSPFQK